MSRKFNFTSHHFANAQQLQWFAIFTGQTCSTGKSSEFWKWDSFPASRVGNWPKNKEVDKRHFAGPSTLEACWIQHPS